MFFSIIEVSSHAVKIVGVTLTENMAKIFTFCTLVETSSHSPCHIFAHQKAWLCIVSYITAFVLGGQTGTPNILFTIITHILCWKNSLRWHWLQQSQWWEGVNSVPQWMHSAAKQCFKVIQQMPHHATLKAGQRVFLLPRHSLNIQFSESYFQMVFISWGFESINASAKCPMTSLFPHLDVFNNIHEF